VLVTGSLAVGTDSTLAQWQVPLDITNASAAISTGSLGLGTPSLTITREPSVSQFTLGTVEMYELDWVQGDWVTLTTHATPTLTGTGLGAVVSATFHWDSLYASGGWAGVDFTPTASAAGTEYTPVTSGSATTTAGVTLQVLVWPEGVALPTGWNTANTVRYSNTVPTIDFSLRIANTGHGADFVLGGTNLWTYYWFWYYPTLAQMGTASLSVRQVTPGGLQGPWSAATTIRIPVVFNANASTTDGGPVVITTTSAAELPNTQDPGTAQTPETSSEADPGSEVADQQGPDNLSPEPEADPQQPGDTSNPTDEPSPEPEEE
jgi:hypothetical protein